jgi:hypothetical protein
MDFLKKHGRFIAVTLVLVVVLWLANDELGGISENLDQKQTTAKSLLTQNYRALFADAAKFDGEPATTEGRKIQDRTQVVEAIGAERNVRMQFETAPEFTPAAKGENVATDDLLAYYKEKKIEVQRELGYQRYFKPDVREDGAFGFREAKTDKPDREEIIAYLRYLDIVRTVAWSVEQAGVQQLNELEFNNGVNDKLRQRGVPTNPQVAGEPPFMTGLALEIQVEATEEALYNFMIELQTPEKNQLRNRYLAVESFEFLKEDLLEPQDSLIDATITVIAYRVNEESSYPRDEAAESTGGQQRRGPRTFR